MGSPSISAARGTATVAIVGRPNVGKSTLFNRLVGRRRSITDATPGVTRDVVAVRTELEGHQVELVDTGGYTLSGDEMAQAVSARAVGAIESASVVVFVVDGTGVTAEDEEFVLVLRPHASRVVVAVNKIDTESREDLIWEHHRFGFEPVVGVSAAHGRGMEELIAAIAERLPASSVEDDDSTGEHPDGAPAANVGDVEERFPPFISIAILGQPNTGKSTLANRMVGTERSLVADEPGTTRDVIEGRFDRQDTQFRIADTAGIRRKSRVSEAIEYYSVTRAIDTIAQAEVVVLMIDAEKGLSEQDKKIANLVVERGRGLILALNKWDLLPRVRNQFEAVSDRIRFLFPIVAFAPIVALSALDGSGVEKLLKTVLTVSGQLRTRVETGKLNRAVREWVAHTPPPMRKHRPFRIRYVTQVARLPVTFVLFVNRKNAFPEAYTQFLKNKIRATFALDKIPIRMELRERS